jgi:hypothetical protein
MEALKRLGGKLGGGAMFKRRSGTQLQTKTGEVPTDELQVETLELALEIGAKASIKGQEVFKTSLPNEQGQVGVAHIPIMPLVDMLKTNTSLLELKCALPCARACFPH